METTNLLNPYFKFFNVNSMEQLEFVIREAYESLQPSEIELAA